jgi:hypothetical protein
MSLRWAVLMLALANVALAGYLVFIDRAPPPTDVRALEVNADQVTLLKAGTQPKTACLEWSNLSEADLPRAQEQLARLRSGGISVRERAIVIADPSPALVARLTELKAAFGGSELRAIACLPNAP